MPMTTHFEQDLEGIRIKFFKMADLAIDAVYQSVEALRQSDSRLARSVIENDNLLDALEKEIDEDCIRFLVTRQPAAVDLRFVLVMLKSNTDLERIGDLSSNIAKECIKLGGKPPMKALVDIPRMAAIAVEMVRDTFTAIAEKNSMRARLVVKRDDEIDDLNTQVYRELFSYMMETPHTISQALGLIMVSKSLERIGDHISNIAERAVYYIEGVDIRHSMI
jgi:phosphate transport system protein